MAVAVVLVAVVPHDGGISDLFRLLLLVVPVGALLGAAVAVLLELSGRRAGRSG